MPIKQVLFGFEGRLSRRGWWEAAVLLVLVQVMAVETAALVLLGFEGSRFGAMQPTATPARLAIQLTAAALMLWPYAAMALKRCRDRGRSGRPAVAATVLLLPLDGLVAAAGLVGLADELTVLLALAALAIRAWLFVQLACLPGTDEDNEYGPPPSRPAPAVEVFS